MSVDEALARASQLMELGQLGEAEKICREMTIEQPGVAEGWSCLGTIAFLVGKLSEAEGALRRAVELRPGHADDWSRLAYVLNAQEKYAEGEACARRAVDGDRQSASHWINLGVAIGGQERSEEACEVYRQALALDGSVAAAWEGLALHSQRLGRALDAEQASERSLALGTSNLDLAANYALLLAQRGKGERAKRVIGEIISRGTPSGNAWFAMAEALRLLGDAANAEPAYHHALQALPTHRMALYGLASVLLSSWRLSEAEECVMRALRKDSRDAGGWNLLGTIQQAAGLPEESLEAKRQAVALDPGPHNHSRFLVGVQYSEKVTPGELLRMHREWDVAHGQIVQTRQAPVRRTGPKPLRVGLVDMRFGRWPTGFLTLEALRRLDAGRCALIGYSDGTTEDDYTAAFRAISSLWRVTAEASDEQLVDQIRRDEVDVLVDLMGHTGRRMRVFAQRAAPVQVTWQGYVGTTGLRNMDFLLADRWHVPEGEETHYAERILRMPNGYVCYGAPSDSPPVGPLPGLESGSVTFGCFNDPYKHSSVIFDAWAKILRQLPSARLFLKYLALNDTGIQRRIREQLGKLGVEGSRIVMEGSSPHQELLAAYSRVDLALDTQPYSGGLTTCESLWMGVPVITCPGSTFAGRHSTSHMNNAGYPRFVAADLDGYVDLAVEWGARLEELAALRAGMREQVRSSPLCDAERFARDWMEVVERAWARR